MTRTEINNLFGRNREAGAGVPRASPHGAAVLDGSGQRQRDVRHLISNGYLSLERSEAAAAVAIAREAWIADNSPEPNNRRLREL